MSVRTHIRPESAVSPTPRSVGDRAWEPVVATHPTDPDRIAVVYEHRGPGAACSINPVIRITRDGGRTWRSTKSSPGSRSSRGMGLHAAIAWGPGPGGRARLYWTNMTTPGCGDGRFSLATSYSDDEGRTWSKLRVERGTPPWVGGFPEIAVDRDPDSPNYGTVYVGVQLACQPGTRPGLPAACLGRFRSLLASRRDQASDARQRRTGLVADRVPTATGSGRQRLRELVPGGPSPVGSHEHLREGR